MGAATTIRRASIAQPTAAPFNPADLAGIKYWFKARDLALADGDPVATWADRSGAGRDLTQGTASKRPLFKANGLGTGKPSVLLDGIDDYMAYTTATDFTQTTTIFAALKFAVAPPAGLWVFLDCGVLGSTGGARNAVYSNTPGPIYGLFAGTVANSALAPATTRTILCARFAGASSFIRANGTQSANINANNGLLRGFGIGADFGAAAPAAFANCHYGEIIVYQAALTTPQILAVEGYLAATN